MTHSRLVLYLFFHICTRTETFRTSVVPSSVNLWNNANIGEQSTEHVSLSMKTYCNELFHVGSAKETVKRAHLQMKCSKLNAHLCALHVADSPAYLCGHNIEDSVHYLIHCPI